MIRVVTFSGLVVLLGFAAAAQPLRPSNGGVDYRDLVAMIRVADSGGQTQFGAGIIAAQTATQTTIVTAGHVVAPAIRSPDATIEVRFRAAPSVARTGRVSPAHYSPEAELDLAVVVINERVEPVLPDALRAVLPASDEDPVAQAVRLIGNMRQEAWSQSLADDEVIDATRDQIVVASRYVDVGASGGAIVNDLGSLVGMTQQDQGVKMATGLPIARIADTLRAWGVQTQWTVNTAAPAMAALKRLRIDGRLQAASIAEAIQNADVAVLKDIGLASSRMDRVVIERALRFPSPGQVGRTTIGEYVEQSVTAPAAAHEWLTQVMTAGVDPNLRVVHSVSAGPESLVAIALRAGNTGVAMALLDAGASPHPYQRLDGMSGEVPLLLSPLPFVSKQMSNPGGLIARLTKAGAIDTSTPSMLQNTQSEPICTAATTHTGFDWCRFVRALPSTVAFKGILPGGYQEPIYGYRLGRLQNLLHVSNDTAYLLASDPARAVREPGDRNVIVEVPRGTGEWTVSAHLNQYAKCKPLPTGQVPGRCWNTFRAWPFYLPARPASVSATVTPSSAPTQGGEALRHFDVEGITLATSLAAAQALLEKAGYQRQGSVGPAPQDISMRYSYYLKTQGANPRFEILALGDEILAIFYRKQVFGPTASPESELAKGKAVMAALEKLRGQFIQYKTNDAADHGLRVLIDVEGRSSGRRLVLKYGTSGEVLDISVMQRFLDETSTERAFFDGYWKLMAE